MSTAPPTGTPPSRVHPRSRVLIVDDEPALRRTVARALVSDFEVLTAEDGVSALGLLATTRVDLVLLDLAMPRMSGAEVLARLKGAHPDVEVVVMAAHGELDQAVAAVHAGAFGLVEKPIDESPALATVLARAIERRRLVLRARALEERLAEHERFGELVGSSARMQDVYRKALGLASSSAAVLLAGERGAGKELLARVIHQRSARADGPFIAVSCGAIPEALVEEELFGSARGLLGAADRGTLFLDEIGELPLPAQVALLGVLSAAPRRVEVRLIAATHIELRDLVAAGRFREDLYYRLSAITLHVPPLRQRKDDIPLLAHHFLQKYGRREGREVRRFSPEAMRLLREHAWPGNVRELMAAIEYAAVMSRGDGITPADLPASVKPEAASGARAGAGGRPGDEAFVIGSDMGELPYVEAKERAVDAFDRAYVEQLMRRVGGNVSEAARQAGMDRSNFRRLKKKVEGKGEGEGNEEGERD